MCVVKCYPIVGFLRTSQKQKGRRATVLSFEFCVSSAAVRGRLCFSWEGASLENTGGMFHRHTRESPGERRQRRKLSGEIRKRKEEVDHGIVLRKKVQHKFGRLQKHSCVWFPIQRWCNPKRVSRRRHWCLIFGELGGKSVIDLRAPESDP